jgi:hypothetical protein
MEDFNNDYAFVKRLKDIRDQEEDQFSIRRVLMHPTNHLQWDELTLD